ncbi:MAG: NAD(P)/FAD-dependent oxidoreductase [Bacteroidales bacterium]|jgi:phytoene dehydrogenase-like protein|nr:NAD(P)/FAD-dependent oxidoreductase [Bacteroidales bacterium]
MDYDVIVVGGGLGGLTAGAKLAREGRKVLLIEQHSQPGGCATTFKRGDYTLEVGLHEMDGPSPRDMKNRIFSELGVTDKVKLVKVPEFYRFLCRNVDITVPHDPAEAATVLKGRFPSETAGIDNYFDQILNPKRKGAGGEPLPEMSVGDWLDSIINDEDLKLVLLGNLGYFHDDPYSLSMTYYNIAQGSYYGGGGASFIKGGSQMLSDHLARFISDHGGEVLLSHKVKGLTTDNGVVTGVTFSSKRGSREELLTATASEIVMNNAPLHFAEWLPEEYRTKLTNELAKQKTGASLLTVYFGFNNNLSVIGSRHYSTFVFDDSIERQSDIIKNNHAGFDRRSFTFVDYGRIDSALAPEGSSVGAICCTDYLADWEGLTKNDYRRKKEEVAEIFIARMEKILPGFRKKVDYCEVGTAATVNRYTLAPGGAVYGFAQVPAKPSVDASALPGNVHIASAWGKTGGGFSGAIFGGYLCAYNILRKK